MSRGGPPIRQRFAKGGRTDPSHQVHGLSDVIPEHVFDDQQITSAEIKIDVAVAFGGQSIQITQGRNAEVFGINPKDVVLTHAHVLDAVGVSPCVKDKSIRAFVASQFIAAVVTVDIVISGAPSNHVIAARAEQLVVSIAAADPVIPFGAKHAIVAMSAENIVASFRPVRVVRPPAADIPNAHCIKISRG